MELLTIGAASRLFKLSVDQLRRLEQAGKIEVMRTPGGHRRFVKAALEAYIAAPEEAASEPLTFVSASQAAFEAALLDKHARPMHLGIPDLDTMMGPIHKGSFGIIFGKSGCGKTSLLTTAAVEIAKTTSVALASLEATSGQIYINMLRQQMGLSRQEAYDLLDNKPKAKEIKYLDQALKKMTIFDSVPLSAHSKHTPVTVERLEDMCDQVEEATGEPVGALLIDHLGLLSPSLAVEDRKAKLQIIQDLIGLANRRDMLVILLVNLPKNVAAGQPVTIDTIVPTAIRDWSSFLLSMWRPEMNLDMTDSQREKCRNEVKVAILKNRWGPGGGLVSHLTFNPDTLRYE